MRYAKYPQDAIDAYTSLLLEQILPLLDPGKVAGAATYPSWMTDDHTPVEFSLILGRPTKASVRFAFEPSALPQAGENSIVALRHTLERLAAAFPMEPKFDLEWFDICAEQLLLPGAEQRPGDKAHPVSETFIGFDCGHYSGTMKVYFMPRIRSLVSKESTEDMMKQLSDRLGLEKPWSNISQFLAQFLPADRPRIDIVAIDCVPGAKNRLKIYFRTHLLSCSHMEHFLTLGGALPDVSTGLNTARLLWNAMTGGAEAVDDITASQASYFPSSLIYYELRRGDDFPSSKVYLPVRRYLLNDMEISQGVERLASQLSEPYTPADYPNFIQNIFPHRALSSRTGIHTYICCTVKPGGGDVSVYYSPESFAPERDLLT
ncbi:aromatic prenyltransferase [Mycena filopes]|nr:aromatic prenyltransferase [Mycena filopes]